jgi:hypothetical protein
MLAEPERRIVIALSTGMKLFGAFTLVLSLTVQKN